MTIYRIGSIGIGGFKVQVSDEAGGLRVIGIFQTEAEAKAWIDTDRRGAVFDANAPESRQAGSVADSGQVES